MRQTMSGANSSVIVADPSLHASNARRTSSRFESVSVLSVMA